MAWVRRWWRSAVLAGLGCMVCTGAGTSAPRAHEVRVLSSLETVRPRDTPGGGREARLEAARGEWESFQVVVHAGGSAVDALSVGGESLLGPGGARVVPLVSR